ncbi:MAG: MucB/RseB C-terminal domain-containing protein [Colwellia sp.]
MKLLTSLLLLLSLSVSLTANAVENDQAELLLERLSHSLNHLNFATSFVVVKNNQAEPYNWLHGVTSDNVELEILARLNGPRHDVLRKGDVISYIESEIAPYSVVSNHLSGPIPAIFSDEISELKNNYHFVSVGRSRILGRAAQLIRIVPKDTHRFGYWLWLDQTNSLLLKLAVITRKGQLLEQIQFTHLDITDTLSENLVLLNSTDLPKIIDLSVNQQNAKLAWQVNWLPNGFKSIKANRHRMSTNKQAVEFMLFNDGLVDVSVYVGRNEVNQRAMEFVTDGATLVLNQVINGFEISVIGKIPLVTAKRIADSVDFIQQPSP